MPFRNERPWHELFFELKSRPDCLRGAGFLGSLRFDWNGPYPKCQELSSFLHALHCNMSASAANPSFKTIALTKEVVALWTERYASKDLDTERVFQEALRQAKVKFSCPSPAGSPTM
jgi:hypothetical protein